MYLSLSFSCCWKDVRLKLLIDYPFRWCPTVSVVVERMYDWSFNRHSWRGNTHYVSVVVERMYDWSRTAARRSKRLRKFQLLLKGCTIEARTMSITAAMLTSFSCCWKDVRLKLRNQLIENKWFLTVGFWSVFRKWSICTKSAIIFENLGWFGWLLDCFW